LPLKVAVVDHGMGNLRSVARALEAAGAGVQITADPPAIDAADALCVPGQGIFGRCIANLRAAGLDSLVETWVASQRPFLGICIGMQILFDSSEEGAAAGNPAVPGLGILAGRVTRLPSAVRVPHIGWNTLSSRGWLNDEYVYFDHSYAVHPADAAAVEAWCEYGERFAAVVRAGSLCATLFHPEKSGASGIRFLREWIGDAAAGGTVVGGRAREAAS
jgi:imidazole glycerol-phosphate synthase subunit HisH